MEFLSCGFEGRALLFADDLDFAVDGLTRSRNLLKNWNEKDVVESIGFVEPLLPDTISSTSFLDDQLLESNGHKTKDHSPTPTNIANDEKFGTAKQSNGNLFSVDNSVLPAPSAKRARIGDLQPPIPTCQVHGCNKDLSASKDYHKRHKVCDAHSKTGVVIVNGIRQRFCQQCSRFHVLSEFDEGKRSCRKRLAGHNERRRKPQFNTHFRDASKALILSRILPSGFFECNQPSNASRSLKLEDEPLTLRKTVLRFHGMGKEYPSKNCLNAPSSLQELYAGSASGCALSLLSARKHKLLSNSQGMSMAHSLIPAGNDHSNLSTAQSSSSTSVGFEVARGANTVNLLELSLHLQRVEQQKYHGQIKMEDGNFFDSSIV